jgi:hypothetical protein
MKREFSRFALEHHARTLRTLETTSFVMKKFFARSTASVLGKPFMSKSMFFSNVSGRLFRRKVATSLNRIQLVMTLAF